MTGRVAAILAEIVTLVMLAGLAVAGLVFWGLEGGAIDADVLRRPAEDVFARSFEGRRIEIGAIESRWSDEENAVVVTARDMVVRDSAGAEVSRASRLSAALPAFALVRRQFNPIWIEADGGAVTILRGEDGRITGHLGAPGASDGEGAAMGPAGAAADSLRRLRLRGATLFVQDHLNGIDWRIDQARLDYDSGPDGAGGEASGILRQPGGDSRLSARLRTDEAEPGAVLDLEASDFNPAVSGPVSGPLAAMRLLDAPADARAALFVTPDRRWRRLDIAAEIGAGQLSLSGGTTALRGASLDLAYDASSGRLTLNEARVDSDRAAGRASGWVEQDGEDAFAFELALEAPSFHPAALANPLTAERIGAQGVYHPADGRAELDSLTAALGPLEAALSGSAGLARGEEGGLMPDIRLAGPVSGEASPRDILNIWPEGLAAGTRDWIEDRISTARVHDIRVAVNLTPETLSGGVMSAEAMSLEYIIEGAEVRYLDGMPPMTGAAGAARASGTDFVLELEEARIGEIALTGGRIVMPRFWPRGALARYEATAEGELSDMLALMANEPLELPQSFGVDPESIGGRGRLNLVLTRPMQRDVSPARIGFSVEGAFEDVSTPGPVDGFPITDGRIVMSADPAGLVASGPARIGPVEAELEWRQSFFSDEEDSPTRFTLRGALDREDFDAIGAPTRTVLEGATPFELRTAGSGMEIAIAELEADLTAAELTVGEWSKPPGEPGSARLTFGAGEEDGQIQIGDVELRADGLEVRGAALLAGDGQLLSAGFSPVRARGYADLTELTAARGEDGLTLGVSGPFLDVSGFVSGLMRGGAGGMGAPVRLEADIDSLAVSPQVTLSDASLDVAHDGEAVTALRLNADAEGGPVRAYIGPDGAGGRELEAEAADAGLMMQALFGLDQVRGGDLAITGFQTGPGLPWRMDAEMTDFTLVQAPILARILSLASLPGLGEVLAGQGIGFNEFTAPMRVSEGRIVLDEARASGGSLGVTINGEVDLAALTLDLDGAVAPALPVNQTLGEAFGAPRGEGLFAFSYEVEGPFDETRIFVNPLSGLAPGFLRRLFGGGSDAPDDPDPAPESPPEP